jgi:type II secretory pathway component PulF
MNSDEFAFFNQQLASMLRDGIPLETALQRLCLDMRQGALRNELETLQKDLARGVPLAEAVRARQLPELYRRMLQVGAQSNNLPAILTMLADYYHGRTLIWTRLKGLMVYPTIVLIGSLLLSCFLAFLIQRVQADTSSPLEFIAGHALAHLSLAVWIPPTFLAILSVIVLTLIFIPTLRRQWRWKIPAFRESALAQTASAIALMLKSGVPLDNAFELMQQFEEGTVAGAEFGRWRKRLASGNARFPEITAEGQVFPSLFVWTVSQSQENLAAGFERAADLYQARATYRSELLLYSALPCSVLALGLVILSQIQPVIAAFVSMMNALSSMG